jgi:MYXO-CTERM domain-containing protein
MSRAFALTALLCLAVPMPAAAWTQSTSSKGAPIHWSDPCLTMYMHEAGSDDVEDDSEFDAVLASFEAWNQAGCSSFVIQYAGKTNLEITGHLKEDPSVNMVIFRERKWAYTDRPVAFTAVTYNVQTGEVFDADIEMNGEDFRFTTQPEKEPWKIDIQNTITHELGHVVGLDHVPDVEATMFDHAGPGETKKRTLEPDDIDGICALYPAVPNLACTQVEPHFLYYDFPDEPNGGGCGAGSRGTPNGAVLVLLALGVALATRRRHT